MKKLAYRRLFKIVVGANAFFLIALAAMCIIDGSRTVALAQTSDLVVRSELRVCADPANMPFSNQKQEGFENKIADLVGKELNLPVVYTWFPQAIGFIRNTLGAKTCDLVIGYSQGDELVLNTNHYYSSAYSFVALADSDLAAVDHLADPRLKGRKIGIVAGTPPATNMAANGLMSSARPFQLMVDRRYYSPAEDMVKQIAAGELDAGILWGPIAGYYTKQQKTKMIVTPLSKETKGPRMAFRITMGVRQNELDWKRQLNTIIRKHQDEINAILTEYGVPLVDTR